MILTARYTQTRWIFIPSVWLHLGYLDFIAYQSRRLSHSQLPANEYSSVVYHLQVAIYPCNVGVVVSLRLYCKAGLGTLAARY